LQAIIDETLANNQNLRIAIANIEIAHAQYVVQRAQMFPHVNADVSGTESKSRVGASGTTTSQSAVTRSYDASLGFTAFELDVFGRLRSLTHAAQDQYFASEAGARSVRLILVSEVASAYLTMAADRSLLSISNGMVTSNTRTVELTRARLSNGVAPRTDLTLAQTALDQARSDRATLTTQVAMDRNALELLVGAPVADADLPPSIESVYGLLGEVPAGLDSTILLRRPDVVQAEYVLRAANAQIGAARAAFFPSISLTALAGAASPALSALFAGRNSTWTAGVTGSLPIFAGGANVGGLELARGERNLAVAQYQLAIQTAFRQVADALARRGTIKDQLSAQVDLEAAASTGYDLFYARYREGIDPFLNTLIAQRTLYSARQTLVLARFLQANNLVTLYQTLGGDMLIDSLPPPKIELTRPAR
ncbi:MAG: efflux transporter outer rane subunit, partial [Phenylobacterium sp.]|nr:efflux transporter outer rane subunit [Phenylobacterium sp.]